MEDATETFPGGCLCGGVRFEVHGAITELSRCHCTQCRKAQGGAFVAVAPIARSRFTLHTGASLLRAYRATPAKARVFCSVCGSPLYSERDDHPEVMRLRIGALDAPPAIARQYHIHAAEPAAWYEILDAYPRHADMPSD